MRVENRGTGDVPRWYYSFMNRRVRYFGSIPEARTKAEALKVEALKRLEVYEGRHGNEPGTKNFCELVEVETRLSLIFDYHACRFIFTDPRITSAEVWRKLARVCTYNHYFHGLFSLLTQVRRDALRKDPLQQRQYHVTSLSWLIWLFR